jgi:tetratricopeptide (TPR) repeat protein
VPCARPAPAPHAVATAPPQSPPYAEGGDAAADHKAAGIAYDEAGDLKNAILAFGAAAKFAPESGAAWNNLAWALDAFSESPMFIFKMDEAKQAAHTTKVRGEAHGAI